MTEETLTDQGEVIEQAETTEEVVLEDAATSGEEIPSPEAQEEPKKDGVQKRIDGLTAEKYKYQREKEEAEETARQYRQQLEELQVKQAQGQRLQTQPKIEDYDYDHERWAQAYQNWVNDGVKAEQEQQKQYAQQQQMQAEQVRKAVEVQRKITEAHAKYPDFNAKINDPSLPSLAQMNQAAYEAVLDSDAMADIAYYLASNPSEVYQFREMSPIRAIKEVAKIEAKLSSSPASITTAPPPPSNSGRKAEVAPGEPTDINEWMTWRNQNMRK